MAQASGVWHTSPRRLLDLRRRDPVHPRRRLPLGDTQPDPIGPAAATKSGGIVVNPHCTRQLTSASFGGFLPILPAVLRAFYGNLARVASPNSFAHQRFGFRLPIAVFPQNFLEKIMKNGLSLFGITDLTRSPRANLANLEKTKTRLDGMTNFNFHRIQIFSHANCLAH